VGFIAAGSNLVEVKRSIQEAHFAQRRVFYPEAIQPHDIEIQWLTKHKLLTHSLYQFERTYLDQVEP
jgi:hypothetical protein